MLRIKMKYLRGYGQFWKMRQKLRTKTKHLKGYGPFWNIEQKFMTKCVIKLLENIKFIIILLLTNINVSKSNKININLLK